MGVGIGGDNDPARRIANNFELRSTPALPCRLLPLTTEAIITQPYARLAHIAPSHALVTDACLHELRAFEIIRCLPDIWQFYLTKLPIS
jgi:hypothetical protein